MDISEDFQWKPLVMFHFSIGQWASSSRASGVEVESTDGEVVGDKLEKICHFPLNTEVSWH